MTAFPAPGVVPNPSPFPADPASQFAVESVRRRVRHAAVGGIVLGSVAGSLSILASLVTPRLQIAYTSFSDHFVRAGLVLLDVVLIPVLSGLLIFQSIRLIGAAGRFDLPKAARGLGALRTIACILLATCVLNQAFALDAENGVEMIPLLVWLIGGLGFAWLAITARTTRESVVDLLSGTRNRAFEVMSPRTTPARPAPQTPPAQTPPPMYMPRPADVAARPHEWDWVLGVLLLIILGSWLNRAPSMIMSAPKTFSFEGWWQAAGAAGLSGATPAYGTRQEWNWYPLARRVIVSLSLIAGLLYGIWGVVYFCVGPRLRRVLQLGAILVLTSVVVTFVSLAIEARGPYGGRFLSRVSSYGGNPYGSRAWLSSFGGGYGYRSYDDGFRQLVQQDVIQQNLIEGGVAVLVLLVISRTPARQLFARRD